MSSVVTRMHRVMAAMLLMAAVTTWSPAVVHAAAADTAPAVKTSADDYIIGAGDMIKIDVARTPEYSAQVPVRPDGKITTPLVEDMVAEGKSPSRLARDIEKVLGEYVRSPQVSVIIVNAVSTNSQVKVMGQVKQQQAIPYRAGLRVSDVILTAGGMTEFAAPNKAMIKRMVDGKETSIKVKLGDLFNKGKMSEDIELKPGDILMVPESWF